MKITIRNPQKKQIRDLMKACTDVMKASFKGAKKKNVLEPWQKEIVEQKINRMVADGTALAEAKKMMKALTERSINSFGAVKRLFTDSFSQSFEEQMEQEREALVGCSIHPDGREGLKAFVEKRPPKFQAGD